MFEARPPAKVNLTLEVTGRRPDGYHDLWSVFLRIGLTDRLTMRPTIVGTDRLTVSGLPGAPVDGNLVLKALAAVRSHTRTHLPPLEVTLDKQIPAAAGLGGGSSDAASALALAQAAWGVGLSAVDELALAAALGSDVPFFASGDPAAVIEGRGERLMPLPAVRGQVGLLVVSPPVALSTAAVFDRFDELGGSRARVSGELLTELASGITGVQLTAWAGRLRDTNDLWPAAASLEPSLGELRDLVERSTGRPCLMSGSGPTLFCLYPSVSEAAEEGRRLVHDQSAALEGALLNAVDLFGPDPSWRYP